MAQNQAVERERLATRPPVELARIVAERAADEGMSVATYLTEVLARYHDFDLPEYRKHRPTPHHGEEARLSA